jgi:phosphonate transport system ATP-binding protein
MATTPLPVLNGRTGRLGREWPVATASNGNGSNGGGPAVRLDRVWAAYGAHEVLRGVSLDVAQGERRAIIGASGSGKSTLLKLLKGLVPAHRGEVHTLGVQVGGRRGRRWSARSSARLGARVGYIPQNLGLVNSATVLENALMGALHRTGSVRSWLGLFADHECRAAWDALESVGIAHLAERRAHQLSGGERRRLAVARALVQRPELLLADEFLSELDDTTAQQVLDALEKAQAELGMTVILVEHDLRVACTFCDHVTVLCDGCTVADMRGRDADEETLRCLMCPRADEPA